MKINNLTDIVQRNDTAPGRIFDWFIIGLIVVSIITYSLNTLPNLTRPFRSAFAIVEIIIVGVFTIEYCLRVATAGNKRRYIFSFYGFVDAMAVVPVILSAGAVDLQVLKIVHVFRILSLLKLTRYRKVMERFGKALSLAKEEITLFTIVTTILLYFSAIGIYYFEHNAQPEAFPSIPHSLWWATATLTTVGYGDVYPVTTGGKIFTFVILMCGLGIVAVPAGLVATALSRVRQDEDDAES